MFPHYATIGTNISKETFRIAMIDLIAICDGSNAKLWGFLNKNGTFSIVMRMLSLAQQLPTTFSVLLKDFVYM